ncbi:MAG TPA: alpha/beta fold hydrolase, partial [Solirubrobacterales bacterium]|nr:alpha/beta fold hydrolase [Solirubrobacterales bacterium]
MAQVELTAGTIEYEDSGGDGPVVVLVHGLTMDGRQWRHVKAALRPDHRCILPVLPMGAHRQPMRPDADLSLRGMGRIVAEFLEALDLRDVTLCFNDWCGAQVMVAEGQMDRVGGLVLVSCEAFDNYPPGLAGHAAWLSAKIPGGIPFMRQVLLRPRLRRLPFVFGQMTKRG